MPTEEHGNFLCPETLSAGQLKQWDSQFSPISLTKIKKIKKIHNIYYCRVCGEIDKHIHQLAETKMGTDLFGKVDLNATSFRSWNLSLEGLSCSRNTGVENNL